MFQRRMEEDDDGQIIDREAKNTNEFWQLNVKQESCANSADD